MAVVAVQAWAEDDRRTFRVINAASGLADNSAELVVCTKTGRMIISTIGNVNFYDGTSFSHINDTQENQLPLQLYRGGYRIYFDRMHHLWLKNAYVLSCVDLLLEDFVSDVGAVIREMGCQEPVHDFFCDSDFHVWLLTDKGLYGVEQKRFYQVLRDRNLQDIDVLDGKLLTFYDNGEEVDIDLATGKVAHRTQAYTDWGMIEKYGNASVILRDEGSYYQIRSGEKESVLLHFDLKSGQWQRLLEVPYHLNNLAMFEHRLYVASDRGYFVYDPASAAMEHVEEVMLDNNLTLRPHCNTLAFDRQGGMWIGTEQRGLLYGRPMPSPFRIYPLDDAQGKKYVELMGDLTQTITEFNGIQANCMFTDSRGWSWFGTTNGLYLYHTPKSEPIIFNKQQGLYNNVVYSVVEDAQHNIWLSTSCGISCILFEGDKHVFVNSFDQNDNVPSESFVKGKAICLDDGTIAMQTIDHVITFRPEDFDMANRRDPVTLYPKLVRILVNGNVVEPNVPLDDNVVIDRAVSRSKHIYLKADQNSLALIFSGLNYFRPLQTYYRVRVKGLDDEWKVYSYFDANSVVDSKGMLHLLLVGLTPAEYEIEVQASMLPNVWNSEPYQWVVHVNQPWWHTQGVYMLMVIVFVLLLAVNFFLYSRNMRMRAWRSSEEGDIVRKIKSFTDRCESFATEELSAIQEGGVFPDADNRNSLAPKFIEVMLKLEPYVSTHKKEELTLSKLGKIAGLDIAELYDVMSGNLYKSPRELVRVMRLNKAAELLRTTQLSVEQVADECLFYTPNYFIGSFFHQFKLTPKEYREEFKA